jgi:hypothetical protein
MSWLRLALAKVLVAWHAVTADPWMSLTIASGVLAVIAIAFVVRSPGSRRGQPGTPPRAMRVIDLARHGATPDVIARSTGLAYDAVELILRATPTGTTRQPSPAAAAFSAARRSR